MALYGQRSRTSLSSSQMGEPKIIGPDLVVEVEGKAKDIHEKS